MTLLSNRLRSFVQSSRFSGRRRKRRARSRSIRYETLESRNLLASVTVSGGGGSAWFLSDSSITSNGLPSGGFSTSGPNGSGHAIVDASTPGQNDAYDFASMIWVNGTQVGGALAQSGRTVTFAPVNITGLKVQSQYHVLNTTATMRDLVSL